MSTQRVTDTPSIVAIHTRDMILVRPDSLPLSFEKLPEALRRFANPDAPEKAKMMAAKGVVPVKGTDLVAILLQFACDPLEEVSTTAVQSLENLPESVIHGACSSDTLHVAFLDRLVEITKAHERQELLATNSALADATVVRWATYCSQSIAELIALNEQRVLRCPLIIESLYKNKNTRMSTVDRLIDLAVRNNIVLDNVSTFEAHAESIAGQLIPEPDPDGEPLPQDILFAEALAADGDDPNAIVEDKATEEEKVREQFKPLAIRVSTMSLHEKLRMAMIGNAAARAILVRDRSKQVAMAAISGPQVTPEEASNIACSRQVGEDVLRFIGSKRDWSGSYELKKNLCYNPKTPMGISMRYIQFLHMGDLKNLARSKGVPASLKQAAMQQVLKKEKRGE